MGVGCEGFLKCFYFYSSGLFFFKSFREYIDFIKIFIMFKEINLDFFGFVFMNMKFVGIGGSGVVYFVIDVEID